MPALCCAAAPAGAETNAFARFRTGTGILHLVPADIADAAPWFDNGAAGINILLTEEAGEELADLTWVSIRGTMSFDVSGETLVSATVQAAIEGCWIAAMKEGLGEAKWYAQILRGDICCDGKPLE